MTTRPTLSQINAVGIACLRDEDMIGVAAADLAAHRFTEVSDYVSTRAGIRAVEAIIASESWDSVVAERALAVL